MLTPAPVTKIPPKLARGILVESVPASPPRPALVKVAFLGTSYEMHLRPTGPIATAPGKRIIGTIRGECRRIDLVSTGGRFVEPVIGRPRRVQGTVLWADGDALVVDAGMAIHAVPMDPRQSPASFAPGDLVAFDLLDGATFTPA